MHNFLVGFSLLALCFTEIVRAESNINSQLKMYIFDCGTVEVSDMDIFSSSGDYANIKKTLTSSCFLVRHERGDLLWDTGLTASIVNVEPAVNGVFTLSMSKTLPEQLEEIGMKPEDIEFISISHSHFDHIGQISAFKSSAWLVHQRESAAMFSTEKSRNTYSDFIGMKRKIFNGDFDVFGDGSVIIRDMPGHTEGHTVLQLMLPKTGPVLLSGDLYHQAKSRKLKRVPRLNVDEMQTRKSMARFERIASKLGAKVIIQHEKAQIDNLPKSPNFLE